MALDNETRNYVDKKIKDEISECGDGKILREKLKHFERRMIDMNTLIKETAREAVKGIKAVSDEATNSLRKKNNRLFEVILLLIVIGFNVFIVLNK